MDHVCSICFNSLSLSPPHLSLSLSVEQGLYGGDMDHVFSTLSAQMEKDAFAITARTFCMVALLSPPPPSPAAALSL